MIDTTVAELPGNQEKRLFLAQVELTQVVEGLTAVLDSTVRSGYLDGLSGEADGVRQVIALISVCESQAKRAWELSQLCEELQARAPKGL